jgi:formate--tetrahydrofolate ligase
MSVRTDSQIAMSVKMRPIEEIAGLLGISPKNVVQYGKYKAKIKKEAMGTGNRGKLVLVSAITPTPAGREDHNHHRPCGRSEEPRAIACCAIREPSLGRFSE